MLAGRLNRRFTVLEPTEVNTAGSVATSYAAASPAVTFYGQLVGAGGSEMFDAQTDRTEQRFTIKTRYRNLGLTAKKRLSHGDVEYQVESAVDPDGRRKELHIGVIVLG